jgi:uncharacterized protein YfdQ (DUF2303 family)
MATSTSTTAGDEAGDSTAAVLAREFKRLHDVETLEVESALSGGGTILILPEGKRVESLKPILDTYLERPERRKGTATIGDAQSFIDHINRFASSESAVFVKPDRSRPSFTVVYDYHPAGSSETSKEPLTDWLQHRAVYAPELSDQWKSWSAFNGKLMQQADFAQFIEDHITDVIVPNFDDPDLKTFAQLVGGRFAEPSELVALSRGLQINVESIVKNAVTLSTGEIAVRYEEVHRDGAGQPIQIANLFQIAIPVFHAGPLYRLAARLRYRNVGGKLHWSFLLVRPELAFDDAIAGIQKRIEEDTDAAVFIGSPEQ